MLLLFRTGKILFDDLYSRDRARKDLFSLELSLLLASSRASDLTRPRFERTEDRHFLGSFSEALGLVHDDSRQRNRISAVVVPHRVLHRRFDKKRISRLYQKPKNPNETLEVSKPQSRSILDPITGKMEQDGRHRSRLGLQGLGPHPVKLWSGELARSNS